MIWAIVIAAVLALLLITLWVVVRRAGRIYEALFAADHLRELAEALRQAKAEALELADVPDGRRIPRGGFVTSSGLVVLYTIANGDGRHEHTFSLSHRRGWFAPYAASILAAVMARLLGLKIAGFVFGTAKRGRYLLITALDDANHAAYTAATVEIPGGLVAPLFVQARSDAAQIHFKELDGAPERVLPA